MMKVGLPGMYFVMCCAIRRGQRSLTSPAGEPVTIRIVLPLKYGACALAETILESSHPKMRRDFFISCSPFGEPNRTSLCRPLITNRLASSMRSNGRCRGPTGGALDGQVLFHLACCHPLNLS